MIRQNINKIKWVAPTWTITKFLFGKCVSLDSNTNFIMTVNSNR